MLGITVHLPNQKPFRVLNYFGLHTREDKCWQKKHVDSYEYNVCMWDYNDAIWSHHPTRFWQEKPHTRDLYDP